MAGSYQVDFRCVLRPDDASRLVAAGVYYVEPQHIGSVRDARPGDALQIVQLHAEDAAAAIEAVRDALGTSAGRCSGWHVRDVRDDAA